MIDPCKEQWENPPPVQPDAGSWKTPRLPKPQKYRVPAPPANCSAETQAELAELHELARLRQEPDIYQVYHWSIDEPSPDLRWASLLDELCRTYRLSPPAAARVHAYLTAAIYHALIDCWEAKWRYLRPRPTDLDATLLTVIPVPRHPAYPSGHSSVAGAASTILARFFPDEASRFAAVAQEAGIARLKAGIHYRSDHTAGLALGRAVAEGILKAVADDDGPQAYHLPS
jgi:hypothetical protein